MSGVISRWLGAIEDLPNNPKTNRPQLAVNED
jgi:hypothetical protein